MRRTRLRVVEVHPEASFAELAAAPLTTRKTTWTGATTRRGLLADAGIAVPDDLGTAGEQAAVDDVLDAAKRYSVVVWTRCAR